MLLCPVSRHASKLGVKVIGAKMTVSGGHLDGSMAEDSAQVAKIAPIFRSGSASCRDGLAVRRSFCPSVREDCSPEPASSSDRCWSGACRCSGRVDAPAIRVCGAATTDLLLGDLRLKCC